MVEWSITTDCKSVAFGLRRFESYPAHNIKKFKLSLGFFNICLAERESQLIGFRVGFEDLFLMSVIANGKGVLKL